MNLSAFQKQLCIDIAAKKIQRVGDILDHYNLFSVRTYNYSQNHSTSIAGQSIHVRQGASVLVPNNEEIALLGIREFISLWRQLELNELISTFNTVQPLNVAIVRFHNEQHIEFIQPILNTLAVRATDELIPNASLQSFIDSDFLTEEERIAKEAADKKTQWYQKDLKIKQSELEQQKEHNNKVLFWTRLIGIGSIISGITIAAFQFLTYSKERVVTLKNNGALKDIVQVQLVDNNQKNDTLLSLLKNTYCKGKTDTTVEENTKSDQMKKP